MVPVQGRALVVAVLLSGCAGWVDDGLDIDAPDELSDPLPDLVPLAEREFSEEVIEPTSDEPPEVGHGASASFASRRTGPVCTLSSPRVVIRPYLDRDTVHRTITRHRNDLRACYNRALRRDPALTGRIVLSFLIERGAVAKTKIDAPDPTFESCLDQTVRGWTFPSPEGAGRVVVHYPVVFSVPGVSDTKWPRTSAPTRILHARASAR